VRIDVAPARPVSSGRRLRRRIRRQAFELAGKPGSTARAGHVLIQPRAPPSSMATWPRSPARSGRSGRSACGAIARSRARRATGRRRARDAGRATRAMAGRPRGLEQRPWALQRQVPHPDASRPVDIESVAAARPLITVRSPSRTRPASAAVPRAIALLPSCDPTTTA
jgi:hypothetical protein